MVLTPTLPAEQSRKTCPMERPVQVPVAGARRRPEVGFADAGFEWRFAHSLARAQACWIDRQDMQRAAYELQFEDAVGAEWVIDRSHRLKEDPLRDDPYDVVIDTGRRD